MSETLLTAFTTAVEGIKADMLDMAEVALPAGLAVCGIGMAIAFGVGLFKRFAH